MAAARAAGASSRQVRALRTARWHPPRILPNWCAIAMGGGAAAASTVGA